MIVTALRSPQGAVAAAAATAEGALQLAAGKLTGTAAAGQAEAAGADADAEDAEAEEAAAGEEADGAQGGEAWTEEAAAKQAARVVARVKRQQRRLRQQQHNAVRRASMAGQGWRKGEGRLGCSRRRRGGRGIALCPRCRCRGVDSQLEPKASRNDLLQPGPPSCRARPRDTLPHPTSLPSCRRARRAAVARAGRGRGSSSSRATTRRLPR